MENKRTTLTTEQILAATRTFKDVPIGTLKELVNCASKRVLPGGVALFRPGEAYKKEIYILLDGTVVMHRPTGRQDTVLPGDLIGLANYLDKNDYTTKTIATNQSAILAIPEDRFKALEEEHPELFNVLNRVIATKLRERSPDRSISTGVLAHPVTRVMHTPVISCTPETSLRDAFDTMKARKIGSIVVTDDRDLLRGVLTYAGLAEAVMLRNADPSDRVIDIVFETPRVIDPETALWEAEEIMRRHSVEYLIVLDDQNPVGIVSQTDILRILISRPSTLTNRFREADTIKELAKLMPQLVDAAIDIQETNHRPSSAVRLLSEYHLIAQRRVVELTLRWMETKDLGKAPVGFTVLIMGSGGRLEMLLNPDQDNGIIIDDTPISETKEVKEWFDHFCNRLNLNLDLVGYPLCPGAIMARNPLYNKTLSKWKQQISHIVNQPTEKAARWSNVVFDFDTLYGDDALTTELRRHALAEIKNKPRLLKMMSDHDAEGKPAIGFFNQLVTMKDEQGEYIDIKRNGLRIIADAARIFSLQNGIAAQNTADRLNALMRVGKLSTDFKDSVQEAFEELLDLLLTHQIKQAKANKELNKLINPERLSPQSRSTLRMAMRAVKRFQEQLQDDYATDIF
jgi:CBS domain-containing protein